MTPAERFWSKVDRTPTIHGCWVWTAGVAAKVARADQLETAIGDPDGLRSIGVWLNQHNQPKWGDRLVLIAAAAERGADRR